MVSGVTRFNQTGAVLFFPFRRNFHADEQRQLGLLDDRFHLIGHQLGSGFGSSLEVLDLNADGFVFVFPSIPCNSFSFDDLVVGAPFEYHQREDGLEQGGAVYIFYSRGVRQLASDANSNVFHEPLILRGRSAHSQFGASLSRLGNLNNDPNKYQGLRCIFKQDEDANMLSNYKLLFKFPHFD